MSAITSNQTNSVSTNEQHTLKDGFAEMKRDAINVKEDLEVLKQDAAEMTSHATKQAIEAVKTGTQTAGQAAKCAGESVKNCHSAMSKQVAARPTASILLALGAGVVVGRILAARR